MKRTVLFFVLLLSCRAPFLSAQTIETIHPPVPGTAKTFVNTQKQPAHSARPPVYVEPKVVAGQQQWDISLTQHGVSHGSDVAKNLLDSIKQAGNLLRADSAWLLQDTLRQDAPEGGGITPQIKNAFKGNKHTFWAPPDNSMAVSDDGYVVSVINTSILFTDVNGAVLLEENFADFLSSLNLNGLYFDPKVLYDPVEDKFILVVLNGNTPATSTVVVGFSSASNPYEAWWFYTFAGDPTGSNLWMDFPSIGVSTDDVYITGNLYTADHTYSQVLIYQFEKGPGFTGGNVEGIHFADVRDANGFRDFNVVPVSFGFDGSIGPGIYFISTDGTGGTEAMLYYTDNNARNNPNLFVYSASIPHYYAPFDGTMLGTTDKIKTNDCRTLSGFYASGTLHFAFNTRGDDLHTKVYYCRLNTSDLTQTTAIIGQQPYECAFPAVAPFTTSVTDKTVLIGFLRTGSAIFPEFRMIAVADDMTYAGSQLVKAGTSYTNFDAGPLERWGDYTGISRRHSAAGAEVWISGCYGVLNDNGAANVLGSWIAQITDGQTGQAPVANFSANQTVITAGQSVTFSDQSTNSPTSLAWAFPGGTPPSSTVKNPVITYNTPGSYAVALIATNAAGEDLETKANYITVNAAAQAPVANFSASQTTIAAGQSVTFSDQSTNAPTSWAWSFPGGTPASSTVKNPVVPYNTPGTYAVTLVATNAAGNDSETKANYITVNAAAQAPVANFSASQTTIAAGQSVTFSDQSTNAPTSWAWSFPGGTPASSTVKNPVVTYNTPGTYAVTLVATNAAGNDSETKAAYMTVNATVQPPVANFISDAQSISAGGLVAFQDISANSPTSWQWSFPGGLPSSSNLQHPIVIYPSTGCFDVTLVAANAAGNHAATKHCYINVQAPTSVEDQHPVFSRFVLFPNPVTSGRLNVEFELEHSAELDFYIVDSRGIVLKNILRRRVKAGTDQLSFSTAPLEPGVYFLTVLDAQRALLKSEKFIVPQ